MEANLQSRLNEGIRKLQGLVGECCTINTVPYPCIVVSEVLTQELTEGGWKEVSHVTISIALADITCSPVAPAKGNTVLLMPRNRTYRVDTLNPTQTTWEIGMIDVTA